MCVSEKRFSSTFGVVTHIYIDNRKVLDRAIYSKLCKGCTSMKTIASSGVASYETWKLSHNYDLNYISSSPGKEIAGATKIFSSSKEKHGLYYSSFYGDADSKVYPALKNMYDPTKPIKKFDCVGHYQKRVGSRLSNF